jgi:hypothetical protein
MELFDALLSTQVLAGILVIGAFSISIRSTLHFTRSAAEMRPRLSEVERELRRTVEGSEGLRKQVTLLITQITPVREREARLRVYSEKLRELLARAEKEEQEKGSQAEDDRRRRIQRKRIGFDADE